LVGLTCLVWLQLRSWSHWVLSILVGCITVAILFLPKVYAYDPAYFAKRADFQSAKTDILLKVSQEDIMVINSYATPAWNFWMNWGPADPAWVSLPFGLYGSSGLPGSVQAILKNASQEHKWIWLLLPCDSPSSDSLMAQKNQLPAMGLVSEWTYNEGACQTSLLLFQSR
jgi:hypothetical protein